MKAQLLNRRPARRSWATLVLPAIILAVAVSAWSSDAGRSVAVAAARPECPHDSVVIRVLDEKGNLVKTIASLPISGPISDIPEFHDCQRFIVQRPWWAFWWPRLKYDSLYAIFAAFRLDTLPDSLPTGVEVPVATIYSYAGNYDALGIKPGFNCLFLRGGTVADWEARMVPVADSSCLSATLHPTGPATPLEARPVPSTTPLNASDYPAAARWDWDPVRSKQYIGIRCGRAWCEVGAPHFTSSGPYTGPPVSFTPIPGFAVAPIDQQRVTRVKGWYDAQLLDIVVSGRQVPSRVYGVLIPNPGLDRLSATNLAPGLTAFRDTWVHVASAVLDGEYKWNLTRGVNQIWLCHQTAGPGGSCAVPMTQPPLWPPWNTALSSCTPDPDDGGKWWAKIVPQTGPARYRCVHRRSHRAELNAYQSAHPGVIIEIPGTARWRWLLDDAGEWTKCPTGCCTGQ